MRINDDFLNEKPDWLQILVSIIVFISFLAIIGVGLFLAEQAFAYERVLWNEGIGYSTTTGQNMVWSNTNTGIYWIDCNALGISEIASTTVSLYTSSGTNNDFWLVDLQSGRKSDAKYNISTTPKDFSYTFTPPIWCDDTTVQLMGYSSITTAVNFGSKGADDVDAVPHAWCYDSSGTGCNSMGAVRGMDIAIIAVGSFSTSTGGGGGECADCLTGNQEIMEDSLNVIAGGTLVFVTFLFLIVGVIFTIWVLHRFWR